VSQLDQSTEVAVTRTPTLVHHLFNICVRHTFLIACHRDDGFNAYIEHLCICCTMKIDNVAADGAFVYCCRILVWYNYLILNSILNVTYKLLWFVFTASDLCSSVVKLYRLYLLVLVVASE